MNRFVSTETNACRQLLLAALACGLAACASTPVPAGTNTTWYGNITEGEKFETAVGQPAADVERVLWAQDYGYEGAVACTTAMHDRFGCRAGERYMQFRPMPFGRTGHLYLKVENERVSQIAWDLHPAPHPDN